jgi:hypothetical protein
MTSIKIFFLIYKTSHLNKEVNTQLSPSIRVPGSTYLFQVSAVVNVIRLFSSLLTLLVRYCLNLDSCLSLV